MTTTSNPTELLDRLIVLHKAREQEWKEWHDSSLPLDERKAWNMAWDSSVEAFDRTNYQLFKAMKSLSLVRLTSGPYRATLEIRDNKPLLNLWENEEKME